jgi:predicted PurR-regulated permease PerM
LGANHVLSVHWRLISFAIATAVIFLVLFSLRTVLLPVILALLLAYLFRPVVVFLEKRFPVRPKKQKTRRIIIIIGIFIAFAAVMALISALVASTIINSGQQLLNNASSIIESAVNTVTNWLASIKENMPDAVRMRIDDFLNSGGSSLAGAIQAVISRTISFVPSAAGFIFALAATPFFLFYLLLDWDRLRSLLESGNSVWKAYTRDTITIVGKVMGRYIRGQLVLGAIVGTIVFAGMTLIGFNSGLAMALGFLSFVMEMVPVFGPWITLVIGVIVTLAFLPQKILWVIGLHAVIPLLEGNFLVPKIQGETLHIHPALGLFILVMGAAIGGVWGIILAFPFTATVFALYHYFLGSVRAEDHLEAAAEENAIPPLFFDSLPK